MYSKIIKPSFNVDSIIWLQSKKDSYLTYDDDKGNDIWAGLGLGSDLAAAVEGKRRR